MNTNPMSQTIGGFEIVSNEQDRILRKMQEFNAIHEESPNPLAHFKTRLGRHPQESKSKYDGKGKLKVSA